MVDGKKHYVFSQRSETIYMLKVRGIIIALFLTYSSPCIYIFWVIYILIANIIILSLSPYIFESSAENSKYLLDKSFWYFKWQYQFYNSNEHPSIEGFIN